MQQLSSSAHWQVEIFDRLDIAIALCSLDKTLIYANPTFAELHGYSVEELSGKSWEDLNNSTYIPDFVSKDSQTWESLHRTADNTFFAVNVTQTVLSEENEGLKVYFLTVIPKKSPKEDYYSVLKATLTEGVVIHDAQGTIIDANPVAQKILDLSLDQMRDSTSVDFPLIAIHEDETPFPGEDHPAMVTLRTGQPQSNVIMGLQLPEQQQWRWISINTHPLFVPDTTQLEGVVATFKDITAEKQAQQDVESLAERWLMVLNTVAEGITLSNIQGHFLLINEAMQEITGYDAQEANNAPNFLELLYQDPQEYAKAQAGIEQTLTQGSLHNLETRIHTKEGEEKILLVSSHVVKIRSEDWFLSAYRDITQRKHQEEALRESQQLIESIVNTSPQLLYIYDLVTQSNIYVNQQAIEILGYSPQEIQEFSHNLFERLIYPEDLPLIQENILKLRQLQDHEVLEIEYRIRHQQGAIRWLRSREIVFKRASDGTLLQILGAATDITEYKQAELQLRQSEAKLNTLVANLADGILIVNQQGIVKFANPAAAKLFNRPLDHLVNQNLGIPIMVGQTTELTIPRDEKLGTAEMSVAQTQWDGESVYLVSVRDISERRNAEEALRESEERLRATFEQNTVGISYTNAYGQYLWANSKFCEITGYSQAELQQITYRDLTHPEDLAIQEQNYSPPLYQGEIESFSLEKRYIHKDGSIIWIDFSLSTIRDPFGNIKYVVAMVRDITQQKAAESALRQSEHKFRQIAENIREVFYIIDPASHQILYISPAYEQLWGQSSNILYQHHDHWLNTIHRDDRERFQDKLSQFRLNQEFEVEYRIIRPDGSIRWIWDRRFPTNHDEIGISYWVGIAEDITERKLNEEKLNFQAKLLDNVRESVIATDLEGNITYWSHGAEALYGYSSKDVIGRAIASLIVSSNETPEEKTRIKQVLTQGYWKGEYEQQRQDGTRFFADTFVSLVKDENGQPIGLIGIDRDVTERVKVEKALRRSEERLRLITNSLPVCISYVDRHQRYRFANKNYHTWFGYKLEDIEGKSVQDIVGKEAYSAIKPEVDQVLSGKLVNYEMSIPYQTGGVRYIHGMLVPDLDIHSQVQGYYALLTDISDRKRTEDALKESEERFRAIFEQAAVGMALSDLSGKLLRVNPKLCSLLGYSEAELLSYHWQQITHPDDILQDMNHADRLLTGEIEYCFLEKRYIRQDGRIIWSNLTISPVKDAQGHPQYFLGVIEDITTRKEATEALRRERELRDRVLDNLSIGIAVHTVNYSHRLYMNAQFSRIYGHSGAALETIEGLFAAIFSDPSEREQVKTQVLSDIDSGDPARMQWEDITINRGTEQEKIVCVKHIPLYEQNLMISTVWDVTPQKRAEAELRASEARFRGIFEQAAVGIAQANLSGKLTQVNQRLGEILGYDSQELLSFNFWDFTHPDDLALEIPEFEQLIAGQISSYSIEKRFLHRNGQSRWVNLTLSLIQDVGDLPCCFIGIVQDIQERKEAQAELEKAKESAETANRAKSQFLANMSHELRTPLNSILGFTQIMTRSSLTPPKHQKYLEIVGRAGEHLLALINDILDLSKIEAGKLTLEIEDFDLRHILSSLEDLFQLKAQKKGLRLSFVVSDNLPQWVQADLKKLRSTLINLLGNAIKFTESGSVTLRASVIDRKQHQNHKNHLELQFSIEDTGMGIASEDIPHLFEAFVQSSRTSSAIEGTGLGLTISQRFVEMMGGNITVESILGQGSIFAFNIICRRANASQVPSIITHRQIQGLEGDQPHYRILIVEDQPENRQLMMDLLTPVGFELRVAENGIQAIEMWQEWQPHLIWMDMRLPLMDGYEATRRIRASNAGKQPIIIALTAMVLDPQPSHVFAAGCNDFVSKPLEQDIIYEKMAQYLGVRYRYSIASSPNPSVALSPDTVIKQQMASMPREWREDLHQSAIRAREKQITELINEIPPKNSHLSQYLSQLLQSLAFDRIANLSQSL